MAHKNKYTLIYFNARGRAEVTRLLFAYSGVPYEDKRCSSEEWQLEKPNTPYGQAPVLEINGERFGQSIAIATYCAREFGLYGKNNLDGLKIDQVVQLGADLMNLAVKFFFEKDETKKAELMKNFKEVEAPKYLRFYENLLEKSNTGFFVGSSLTLADIFTYDLLYNFGQRKLLTTDGFPKVIALVKAVETSPKISSYLATRQQTEN